MNRGLGRVLTGRARVIAAVAVGLIVLTAGIVACGAKRAVRERPNVLILVMDTTRADHCSLLGYARDTTPQLRELAKESTNFTAAWGPAPWTLPAHATLFTGLRYDHHGCGRDGDKQLALALPTLAQLLTDAGYDTGCFSANPFVAREFHTTRGFSHERRQPPGPPGSEPRARTIHDDAIRWLRARAKPDRPFFVFINNMEPHSPHDPAEGFAARFRRGAIDDPAAAEAQLRKLGPAEYLRASLGVAPLSTPQMARLEDLYDAELAELDSEIGTFVERLRNDGILDNTLLVIVGDHGEGLGDHGWLQHSTILNQEMLRVPLLIRLPGRFANGSVVTDPVRLEDVFATVLDACDLPLPERCDGVPVDRGERPRYAFASEGTNPDGRVSFEKLAPSADLSFTERSRKSVTDGRWHLIVESNGHTQLYDLSTDPREQRNRALDAPEELARLRNALDGALIK